MYVSLDQVSSITGYDVDRPTLYKAQAIVESYTGKMESQIESPNDAALLMKATAYQAAYMFEHGETIFEQFSAQSIGQNNSAVTFKTGDTTSPWIAPLVVIACRNLSWAKAKSITTGSMFPFPSRGTWMDWWTRW